MIDDFQLAAAVTSYGRGTRSFNRSTEARLMKQARASVTQRYLSGELVFPDVSGKFLLCHCSER